MATDFWTRQEKARKRTGLLVFFFSLAVALLVWLIPQRAGSHPGGASATPAGQNAPG